MNRTVALPGTAAAVSMLAASFLAPAGLAQGPPVSAIVETDPVPSSGDAADDSAIWVHPTVPSLSLVIGTDKDAGLAVYDLSGNELQFVPDGDLNNVDLRYGFPLGLAQVALVTSGDRSNNVLEVYAVDPNTRTLQNVAARPIPLGFQVYGCCMYRSQDTGEYYFFGTSETSTGVLQQWRLFDAGGGVDAQQVRTFNVGGPSEGCVADDENGWLFVAEEEVGIWRYGAEPGDGTARIQVDTTGGGGNLDADVEGLSIYYAAGGQGYLLASSQGNNTFVVYQRAAPHAHLLTFQVGANSALGIDAVTETDGIDVTNRGLGSAFPGGLFVAQDDSNPGATQNFKFVAWPDIADLGDLIVDPSYGAPGPSEPPGGGGSSGGKLKGKISLQRDLQQPDPDAFGTIAMSISSGVQAFVVLAKKLDVLGGTYGVFLEEGSARGTFVDIGDLVPVNPNAGSWVLALEATGAISELGGADVNRLAGRRVEIRNGSTPYLFAVLPSLTDLLNVNLQGPLPAAPGSPAPEAVGLVKLRSKAKAGTAKFELKAKGLPVGPTYTVWVAEGTTEGAALSEVGTLVKGKLKIDTKKGQTLPFEVGFLPDLYGRAVEVRDGTTTVLAGTVPSPAATDD